jgi:poly [ADP-ribose] polymerase
LEGKFDTFGETKASLEKFATSLGGKVSRSTTKSTTHVVCSEEAYNAQGKNLKAAEDASLPIVSPQWIIDTNKQGTTLNHDVYLWSKLAASNGAATNGAKVAKKRAASTKADEEPDQKKARAAELEVAKPASEPAEEKKQVAEGQFATKDNVVVELDPYCPLKGWVVYVEPATGLIWDASLNQSNSGKNANKFYKIQVRKPTFFQP